MKTIGITGGVGAGKSTVLDFLRETYQASVCEADKVAHELQRPGEGCYQEILKVFGPEILCDDQTIDRKRLGSIVFADVEKLKRLNGIVHPKVKEWIRKKQRRFCSKIIMRKSVMSSGTSVPRRQCGEGVSGKAGDIRMSGSKELCRIRSQKHSF